MCILPFQTFDGEYCDPIVSYIADGEIKKYSPAEESKQYDYKLFLLENLLNSGVQLKPVVIRESIPVDFINSVEVPLEYIKYVENSAVVQEPPVNSQVPNVEPENKE